MFETAAVGLIALANQFAKKNNTVNSAIRSLGFETNPAEKGDQLNKSRTSEQSALHAKRAA